MARKPEQRINARFKKAVSQLPAVKAVRVENKVATGQPDWELSLPGNRTIFVETKFRYNLSTPLTNWTAVQRNWARSRVEMGFGVLLLLGDEHETILLDCKPHLDTNTIVQTLKIWGTKIDPAELCEVLKHV